MKKRYVFFLSVISACINGAVHNRSTACAAAAQENKLTRICPYCFFCSEKEKGDCCYVLGYACLCCTKSFLEKILSYKKHEETKQPYLD
jgi:hypothetical protein